MNFKIHENQLYLIIFFLIILCFLSNKIINKKKILIMIKAMITNNLYHPNKCKLSFRIL